MRLIAAPKQQENTPFGWTFLTLHNLETEFLKSHSRKSQPGFLHSHTPVYMFKQRYGDIYEGRANEIRVLKGPESPPQKLTAEVH